ncbi:MAG: hypothetical protein U9Q67_00545 [Patescibacteria group bacterium]|nr:hypothetical protein [Patescibacteria group bacterium]
MLLKILATVSPHFSPLGQVIFVISAVLVGLYVYWRSFKTVSSDNEFMTFDLVLFALVISIVVSRLVYIFYNPGEFVEMRWFWLPYEKINGEVFVMATFPWIFFRITDGGFIVDGLILGFIASIIPSTKLFSVSFQKVVSASANFLWFMFLVVELFLAVSQESVSNLNIFLALVLIGVARLLISSGLSGHSAAKQIRRYTGIDFVWWVAALAGLPAFLLFDRYGDSGLVNSILLIVVNITTVLFSLIIVGLGIFLSRSTIDSGVMLNQRWDKLRKTNLNVDEGCPAGGQIGLSKQRSGLTPRKFVLSYKDFSKGWKQWLRNLKKS